LKKGLPPAITLPSGARITLATTISDPTPRVRAEGAPLFSEVLAVFDEGDVVLGPSAVRDLALGDFHVVRALLTKAGFVEEEELEIDCANCSAKVTLRPCALLEVGPYIDGELDDEELDRVIELDIARDIPPIPLGRVREAKSVTLTKRSVEEALPLYAALAKDPFDITADVVRGLGIAALGPEKDAEKIAQALNECDDVAFASVTDLFLATHYPLRLGAIVFCEACKARNDVDAPYEREFAQSGHRRSLDSEALPLGERKPLPSFDGFAELAREIARPMLAGIPGEEVELVIDGGTPAVDDGGEPLLGSYVPPHPGDSTSPTRPPTVTLYFKTFEAIEKEDPGWDWEDELEETIEHELEHHVYFLRGDDPMDAQEREEIDREALRIVGKKEAGRRAITGFGDSLRDFVARTWPLWLIALIALLLTLAAQRE